MIATSEDQTVKCPRCPDGRYTPYGVEIKDGMPPHPALAHYEQVQICSACGDRENEVNVAMGSPS